MEEQKKTVEKIERKEEARGTAREFEHAEACILFKVFLEGGIMDLDEAGNLQEEIGMMRVVTRRLLEMARGCKDMGELINVLGALRLASTRVAGLMKSQKFLGGNRDRLDDLIDSVLDEVTKDWPVMEDLKWKTGR